MVHRQLELLVVNKRLLAAVLATLARALPVKPISIREPRELDPVKGNSLFNHYRDRS